MYSGGSHTAGKEKKMCGLGRCFGRHKSEAVHSYLGSLNWLKQGPFCVRLLCKQQSSGLDGSSSLPPSASPFQYWYCNTISTGHFVDVEFFLRCLLPILPVANTTDSASIWRGIINGNLRNMFASHNSEAVHKNSTTWLA